MSAVRRDDYHLAPGRGRKPIGGMARANATVTLTGSWGVADGAQTIVLLNGVEVPSEPDPVAPTQRLAMTVPQPAGPFPVPGQVTVAQGAQSSQALPLQVLS